MTALKSSLFFYKQAYSPIGKAPEEDPATAAREEVEGRSVLGLAACCWKCGPFFGTPAYVVLNPMAAPPICSFAMSVPMAATFVINERKESTAKMLGATGADPQLPV